MYRVVRPLLFRLDPERAHQLVFGTLRALGPAGRGGARLSRAAPDPRLRTRLAGLSPEPRWSGSRPGQGRYPGPFLAGPRLRPGRGLGTVTALAQPGNPRPRLFRFPDAGALVNRMGFNNAGSQALADRLGRLRAAGWRPATPIGVNLGKSKVTPLDEAVEDYGTSARRLASVADYMVVNVSSPNTPGLRQLQDAGRLGAIVEAVRAEAGALPVFVKLAPDLTDEALDEAVAVAESRGELAGIIATNTTIARHGLPDVGPGGLSGRPLHARSVEVVRRVAAASGLPIIGVGGIRSTEDVLAMLGAGATAVQVYTALIFEGPGLIARLNAGLVGAMEARGVADMDALTASLRAGGP